jgi:hypothetical protein
MIKRTSSFFIYTQTDACITKGIPIKEKPKKDYAIKVLNPILKKIF